MASEGQFSGRRVSAIRLPLVRAYESSPHLPLNTMRLMSSSASQFSRTYASSILIVSTYIAMRVLSRSDHHLLAGLCFIVFFLQLPYLFLRAAICAVRKNFRVAKPYVTALIVGLVFYSWLFLSNKTHFDTRLHLLLFPGHYHHCVESGLHFGKDKVISVCALEDEDNLALIATEPVFEVGVIYDSSDEIKLPSSQHSSEWRNAALKLPPFGLMNYEATPVGNHFYYVRFSSETPPKL